MIHKIKTFDIDVNNPTFLECAEWLTEQDWYIGSSGRGAKLGADTNDQQQDLNLTVYGNSEVEANHKGGVVAKLNRIGSIKGSSTWEKFPDVSGVWRSPFGWSDESCMRRAPAAWKLFEYINNKFFNNSFTLDGFPEEIGGTRGMWSPKYGEDKTIPGYGTLPEAGSMNPIWTSYGIGKTGGVLFEGLEQAYNTKPSERVRILKSGMKGTRRTGSVGIHRDAAVDDIADADGYFSILINMNISWKPSWGGDLLYYETIDNADEAPETHWNRGYGIGYADTVIPHKPGQVTCCPAAALHTAANDKYDQSRTDYLRRIMFRVRYKDLLNDDFEGT